MRDGSANGGVFARGGCFPASLCLRLFDFRKESFQGWKLPDSASDGARFFGDQRRVDHDFDEAMLLQAMFYLAEGKMDGNLFSQFLREAVSGSTGTWQDC